MRLYFILIIVVSLFFNSLFGSKSSPFANEVFLGRLGNAKSEAMGRITSVLDLNGNTFQTNPTNLLNTKTLNVFFGSTNPYYLLYDAKSTFSSISFRKGNHAFGVNTYKFSYGEQAATDVYGNNIKKIYPNKQIYTFGYAGKYYGLEMGLNYNLFIDDFDYKTPGREKQYFGQFFNFGLTKKVTQLSTENYFDQLIFAASILNGFANDFEIMTSKVEFPQIAKYGISNKFYYYNKDFSDQRYLLGFTAAFEFQDNLNYDFDTAYKCGFELSILDLLFLRSGYYYRTKNDHGYDENKDHIKDFTYGIGLKVDMNPIVKFNCPLTINCNYTSLKQPSTSNYNSRWSNFKIFNFSLNYKFE